MARIKSAWEIALEKTQDIQLDEEKYRTENLEKEGMALAGKFLNTPEMTLDELRTKYEAYNPEDRNAVKAGIVRSVFSNISLPSDDLYKMRFEKTSELAGLIRPEASGLMEQIGDFFEQYLNAREEFSKRMEEQIKQAMREDPQQVNSAQFAQAIEQNLKRMEDQYAGALESSKSALHELLD